MGDELHIYDFDSTLFRSPHAPAVWEGDWWSDPASLLPPCVPEKPGSEWWIPSTVAEAKRSISDPDVFAIMMTGRTDRSAFRYRVPELLKQRGLRFDAVHLDVGPDEAINGKLRTALKYLSRYPDIDTVRVWDDRPSHLRTFERVLGRRGYTVHTELVRARSMAPLCEDAAVRGAPPKKVSYVGIFLDAASKSRLGDEYTLAHDKPKAEHVTLGFKLTPEFEALVGMPVRLKVVGYAEDDLGQAVVVDLPSDVPFKKKGVPHVTISHDGSVGPKYSNDLIAGGYERVSGPTLTGVIDTFPRSLKRTAGAAAPSRVAALARLLR